MKQYLLFLRSSDFDKQGNVWSTGAINVYSNSSYTNYSYKRSRYGTNLVGEGVYTGVEVTSPSFGLFDATPELDGSVFTTDIGEVVGEVATPDLFRFVDTSSPVDLISYRLFFPNMPGDEIPNTTFIFEESDEPDGPWLTSVVANDAASVLQKNVKKYIKITLEINSETPIPASLGLLLYVEFVIHSPSVPVISRSVQEVLSRFPSWTDLYTDSLEPATPSTYIPISTGGRFINALLQEDFDNYEDTLVKYELNSFVSSVDLNQIDWAYVTEEVVANIVNVFGDGVELVPCGSIYDFYASGKKDYVYYYSASDRQIITNRKYDLLLINSRSYPQTPYLVYNDLDELGAKVGLPRLYLEENERYRLRILDVYRNPPVVNQLGFQTTLRRELDIWRAYGATPDSFYIGATPEILEISDLEVSTPYFNEAGHPLQPFKDFVKKLNERYPSNLGYVKWNQGIWDYAGYNQEGVGRIPAIYDNATPLGKYYQPGVGDFDDFEYQVDVKSSRSVDFGGKLVAKGVRAGQSQASYYPVYFDYDYWVRYQKPVPAEEKSQVALVYELDLFPHDNYATPSTFYANLNFLNREDFTVYNSYSEISEASPEYNYIPIFDQDGFTLSDVHFRDKVYNELYLNTEYETPNPFINILDVERVRVVLGSLGWDPNIGDYEPYLEDGKGFEDLITDRVSLSLATPSFLVRAYPDSIVGIPGSGDPFYSYSQIELSTPGLDASNVNLLVGSDIYSSTVQEYFTEKLSSGVIFNADSDNSQQDSTPLSISVQDLWDSSFYPPFATPTHLYIDPVLPYIPDEGLPLAEGVTEVKGAVFYNPENDSNTFIPSSPNIAYQLRDSNSDPVGAVSYFESATIDFSSSAQYVEISLDTSAYPLYPVVKDVMEPFILESDLIIEGSIDRFGQIRVGDEETYSSGDNFAASYPVTRSTFGINDLNEYNFESIEIVNKNNEVLLTSNIFMDDLQTRSRVNKVLSTPNFEEDGILNYPIFAKRNEDEINKINSYIKEGWIHLGEESYYQYFKPTVESFLGRYFDLPLQNIPRKGAPVRVTVDGDLYREIPVYDDLTLGRVFEKIKIGNSNKLFTAYEDIYGVTVVDDFTGQIVLQDYSTLTNEIEVFEQTTPDLFGREYSVSYFVSDSYYLDKDYYDEATPSYYSNVSFFATPSTDAVYEVVYESEMFDSATPIDLEINTSKNPLDYGYVFVSKTEYPFKDVDAVLSPNAINGNVDSKMNLSIVSYDTNGNPKPYQAFYIYGDNISADPEYVLANSNGFGYAQVTYNASTPSSQFVDSLFIEGISISDYYRLVEEGLVRLTEDGEERFVNYEIDEEIYSFTNSDASSYSEKVDFYVSSEYFSPYEVKAVVDNLVLPADAESQQFVYGQVYYLGNPASSGIRLFYRQADTLFDAFVAQELDIQDSVVTDEFGQFTIGPITVRSKYDPGYRFLVVETDGGETGATPENGATIAGDIVYWYEQYDSVHYDTETLPPSNAYYQGVNSELDMVATPSFVFDRVNINRVVHLGSTPSWLPPRWYAINRQKQYQLGLLGSTPNFVETYANLHPDYREN